MRFHTFLDSYLCKRFRVGKPATVCENPFESSHFTGIHTGFTSDFNTVLVNYRTAQSFCKPFSFSDLIYFTRSDEHLTEKSRSIPERILYFTRSDELLTGILSSYWENSYWRKKFALRWFFFRFSRVQNPNQRSLLSLFKNPVFALIKCRH